MGAWGEGPYDNDRAADWFHDVLAGTGFRDRIVAGLESGDPDLVRAAAWVVSVMGKVYVWPIDHLDDDRAAARRALEALLADADWMGSWADPEAARAAIEEQLASLP